MLQPRLRNLTTVSSRKHVTTSSGYAVGDNGVAGRGRIGVRNEVHGVLNNLLGVSGFFFTDRPQSGGNDQNVN